MKFYLLSFIAFIAVNTVTVAQSLTNCATCSSNIIRPEQIKNLSIDELRFLTNDLFARRGYQFKAPEINAFYSDQAWYKPVKDNKEVVFNEIEKQNIELFQNKTTALKATREKLISELKALQQLVYSDNKQELQQRFGFNPSPEHEYASLVEAMKKLDFNEMNWMKNTGLYELTVDNGDIVMSYTVRVDGNKIQITYNQQGRSRIAPKATLYPGENWVSEFAFFWIFEFNGKLRFVKYDMAG